MDESNYQYLPQEELAQAKSLYDELNQFSLNGSSLLLQSTVSLSAMNFTDHVHKILLKLRQQITTVSESELTSSQSTSLSSSSVSSPSPSRSYNLNIEKQLATIELYDLVFQRAIEIAAIYSPKLGDCLASLQQEYQRLIQLLGTSASLSNTRATTPININRTREATASRNANNDASGITRGSIASPKDKGDVVTPTNSSTLLSSISSIISNRKVVSMIANIDVAMENLAQETLAHKEMIRRLQGQTNSEKVSSTMSSPTPRQTSLIESPSTSYPYPYPDVSDVFESNDLNASVRMAPTRLSSSKPLASFSKWRFDVNERRRQCSLNDVNTDSNSWLFRFRADIQQAIEEGRVRPYTLNECKKYFQQVLAGLNYPAYAQQSAESLLYTIVDTKYGLRKLTVEACASLLCGADMFEQLDWLVRVFVASFRNQVEDKYYNYLQSVVGGLRDALGVVLQELNSGYSMSKSELKFAVQKFIVAGSGTADLWRRVLLELFSKDDTTRIMDHIFSPKFASEKQYCLSQSSGGEQRRIAETRSAFGIRAPPRRGYGGITKALSLSNSHRDQDVSRNGSLEPNDGSVMAYSQFENSLMLFLIESCVLQYRQLQDIFTECDFDGDGILSHSEFSILIQRCWHNIKANKGRAEVATANLAEEFDNPIDFPTELFSALLSSADPSSSGKISYSGVFRSWKILLDSGL